jgi:hypothetical protein
MLGRLHGWLFHLTFQNAPPRLAACFAYGKPVCPNCHPEWRIHVAPMGTPLPGWCQTVTLQGGVDGCPSPTHGDLLAIPPETPEEATERYVKDLISSENPRYMDNERSDRRFAVLRAGRDHCLSTMGRTRFAATYFRLMSCLAARAAASI